jgi:hypothetical protein
MALVMFIVYLYHLKFSIFKLYSSSFADFLNQHAL